MVVRTRAEPLVCLCASNTQRVAPGFGFLLFFCFILCLETKSLYVTQAEYSTFSCLSFLSARPLYQFKYFFFFFLFHTGDGAQGHVSLTVAEDNMEKVSNTCKITALLGVKVGFEPRQ